MVAAPGNETGGAKGPMHTEASKGATPIVWAPRTGRSKAYKRWRHAILDGLADLGFNSFEEALDFSPPSQDALSQLAGDGLDTRAKRANADEVLSRAVCPLPSCPRPRACHIAVEGVRVGGLGEGEGYHGHPREERLSRSSGVTLAGEAFILAHLWPGPTHM